jgi:hypothetical protein
MIKDITDCPYWQSRDYDRIRDAASFRQVGLIALEVMSRMPRDLSEYCGPISTGGLDRREKNIWLFRRCVEELRFRGHNPFDQVPLQVGFKNLVTKWRCDNPDADYCWPIIDVTYDMIFRRGRPNNAWFAYNWKSSKGTTRERTLVARYGINMIPFPILWYERILVRVNNEFAANPDLYQHPLVLAA